MFSALELEKTNVAHKRKYPPRETGSCEVNKLRCSCFVLCPSQVTSAGEAHEGEIPWLLARGQGLHMQGIIGILGGSAETLVRANHRRMNKSPQVRASSLELIHLQEPEKIRSHPR